MTPDFDRFNDDYDPEPDYEKPTRAEALADELADEQWASRFAERDEAQALATGACPARNAAGWSCCYRHGHDLSVFPHRFVRPEDWDEPYCDYCEEAGHRFSACPKRDDEFPEEWPDFGIGPMCEEDPELEGFCAYHRVAH